MKKLSKTKKHRSLNVLHASQRRISHRKDVLNNREESQRYIVGFQEDPDTGVVTRNRSFWELLKLGLKV